MTNKIAVSAASAIFAGLIVAKLTKSKVVADTPLTESLPSPEVAITVPKEVKEAAEISDAILANIAEQTKIAQVSPVTIREVAIKSDIPELAGVNDDGMEIVAGWINKQLEIESSIQNGQPWHV